MSLYQHRHCPITTSSVSLRPSDIRDRNKKVPNDTLNLDRGETELRVLGKHESPGSRGEKKTEKKGGDGAEDFVCVETYLLVKTPGLDAERVIGARKAGQRRNSNEKELLSKPLYLQEAYDCHYGCSEWGAQ